MKKLLALLLAICCIFSVVSCKRDEDPDETPTDNVIARFSEMLNSSVPTKSVATSTEVMSKIELVSTHTLTTGTNQDGKRATLLESVVQSLQDAESGYVSYIKTTTTREWYIEGEGLFRNNRLIDADGQDFAPVVGSLALNLDESLFESYEYDADNDTLTIYVDYENSAQVLAPRLTEDQVFDYDVVITIVAAGGRISQIDVAYMHENDTIGDDDYEVDVDEMEVVISTVYYYNTQEITIG